MWMNLTNWYPLPFLSQSRRTRWNLRQIKKKPGTTIQILIKPKGGRDYRMFWWKCRLELLGTYLKGMAWHRSSPGTCRPGRSWTEQLAAGRPGAAAGPAGWSEASLPGCSLMKIIIQVTSSNTSQHSFKIFWQTLYISFNSLQGTVARDFRPPVFSWKGPTLDSYAYPNFFSYNFFWLPAA